MQKDREAEVCKGVLVEEEDWPRHRGLSIGNSEGVKKEREKKRAAVKHKTELIIWEYFHFSGNLFFPFKLVDL